MGGKAPTHIETNQLKNIIFSLFLFAYYKFHTGLTGKFFQISSREETCIKEIRDKVGSKKLMVLVSGGVDSTVLLKLCHKALPAEQVCFVYF